MNGGILIYTCNYFQGVNELRETIITNTLKQKYMGEKIPEAWLTLEKRLISYREEKNTDILPFKTLEAVSATCGIFDKGEVILSKVAWCKSEKQLKQIF